jgi:hypothetical protein
MPMRAGSVSKESEHRMNGPSRGDPRYTTRPWAFDISISVGSRWHRWPVSKRDLLDRHAPCRGGVPRPRRAESRPRAHMVQDMAHLGYPPYFPTILRTWKVLGALTIVLPLMSSIGAWRASSLSPILLRSKLTCSRSPTNSRARRWPPRVPVNDNGARRRGTSSAARWRKR